MTVKQEKYSQGWDNLNKNILEVRAQHRCECVGECGQHGSVTAPDRCTELQGQQAVSGRGTVNLALAHICDEHGCLDVNHLRAMCQRCHLHFYTRPVADAGGRRPRRRKHNSSEMTNSPRRRISDLIK